jgi:hypothetical protein
MYDPAVSGQCTDKDFYFKYVESHGKKHLWDLRGV